MDVGFFCHVRKIIDVPFKRSIFLFVSERRSHVLLYFFVKFNEMHNVLFIGPNIAQKIKTILGPI